MAVQNEEESSVKSKTGENTPNTSKTEQSEVETAENGKIKEENEDSKKESNEKIKDENNDEDDEESLKDELDDDEQQGVSNLLSANVGKKSFLGHTCSVKTLIDDNVLIPEDNALSFEFMVSRINLN